MKNLDILRLDKVYKQQLTSFQCSWPPQQIGLHSDEGDSGATATERLIQEATVQAPRGDLKHLKMGQPPAPAPCQLVPPSTEASSSGIARQPVPPPCCGLKAGLDGGLP